LANTFSASQIIDEVKKVKLLSYKGFRLSDRVVKKMDKVELRGCLKSPLVGIKYFLPHPNPLLIKGREPDFLVSPLSKGGLRGVRMQLKSQPTTFQTSS
jgi:hypothetical protein